MPFFGVPEALLSDRGTNLSNLMLGICKSLGTTKLNTTSCHPQCDGMVERFNRTLKAMLRKRAAQYRPQCDKHLSGVLWVYRNTPHSTTGEKPSFLLFGWDCKSPCEAAMLPPASTQPTTVADYRRDLMESMSSARQSALQTIRRSQKKYKKQYNRKSHSYSYRAGD